MAWCDRGVQILLTIVGAFVAFSLMTIAIGTDFWLYSRAYICNTTNLTTDDTQLKKTKGDLTHSGLWRICCIEEPPEGRTTFESFVQTVLGVVGALNLWGINEGSCFRINHFPGDNDYDTDSSEYILRIVRASSLFPILSTILLLLGGLCVGIGKVYSTKNNILLSGGILFVAAGLSNIIGIIVYISSNAGDPSDKRDEDKKNTYSYGWSFYFGALSFIVAESVGVLAVNIYIEKNKERRFLARREFIKTTSSSSPYSRIPSYRYRRRRSRSSSHSTDPSREPSPVGMKMSAGAVGGGGGGGGGGMAMGMAMADMSMYAMSRDPMKSGGATAGPYSPERDSGFLQIHNCFQKDLKDGVNRRTTPV